MNKIIIVEDDPMIMEIYEKKFSDADFEVSPASSGKEALKVAKSGHFDLILLDLVMSEMGGMEALKEFKESGNYDPNLKVVIFSNLTDKENIDDALEHGADGFISKTQYSPSELIDEVKRLINEFKEQDKNDKKDVTLGDSEGSVKKNGKKILFIEDEDIFLELFGKKLQNDGYEVEFAKNGAWGMKEAMDNKYDLIIMDVVMPSMSGREMLDRLKKEEETKNIPVIVLSASSSDEELMEMKKMGAEEYFLKTRIVPSDLSRKVSELLKV